MERIKENILPKIHRIRGCCYFDLARRIHFWARGFENRMCKGEGIRVVKECNASKS